MVDEGLFRKIGIFSGVIETYCVGIISSMFYSERLPINKSHIVRDLLIVPLLNPYALLGGLLMYGFFIQVKKSNNADEKTSNKNVYILIGYLLLVIGFNAAIILGILVY